MFIRQSFTYSRRHTNAQYHSYLLIVFVSPPVRNPGYTGECELTSLGVVNLIFDDAYGAKLWLTGCCFFPPWKVIVAAGLGISVAGMWSGMDDDNI